MGDRARHVAIVGSGEDGRARFRSVSSAPAKNLEAISKAIDQHITVPMEGSTVMASRLLICGLLAGPLFIGVTLAQALTREGFNLTRHPISLLSLGGGGWVEVANFIVAGALCLACAAGLRTSLRSGPGRSWAPG